MTHIKDAFRNIRMHLISWLAVALLVMLSTMLFLGIRYSSDALKAAGNDFYRKSNFRDLQVIASLLMSPEDLAAICAVDGVKDAEGVIFTTGRLKGTAVQIQSLTSRINVPILKKGKLPSKPNECVLEYGLAKKTKVKIGDKVELLNSTGGKASYLKNKSFKVVGYVYHPDHIKDRLPENLYVIVTPEAFDDEKLEGYFMKAEVQYDDEIHNLDAFSLEYFEAANSITDELKELSVERASMRDDEIQAKGEAKLADFRAKLDEVKAKLKKKESDLKEKEAKYKKTQAKVIETKRKIVETDAKLAETKTKLEQTEVKLTNLKAKIDQTSPKLEATGAKLKETEKKLVAYKSKLTRTRQKLNAAKEKVNKIEKQYKTVKTKLEGYIEKLLAVHKKQISKIKNGINILVKKGYIDQETANKIIWKDGDSKVKIDIDAKDFSVRYAEVTDKVNFDFEKSFEENVSRFLDAYGVSAKDKAKAMKAIMADKEAKRAQKNWEKITKNAKRLDKGVKRYQTGVKAITTYREKIRKNEVKYHEAEVKLAQKETKYNETVNKYNESVVKLNKSIEKYNQGAYKLNVNQQKYMDNMAKLAEKRIKVKETEGKLQKMKTKLAEARKKLAEAKERYLENEAKYAQFAEKLANFRKCQWFTLDRGANLAYIDIDTVSGSLGKLGVTFSSLFCLIAALVCYTTIGRLLEDQHTVVGTARTLGIYTFEIIMKYMFFGLTSILAGAAGGIAIAYYVLEKLILDGYKNMYVFGRPEDIIVKGLTIGAVVLAVWVAVVAIQIASVLVLRHPIRTLMHGIPPRSRKRRRLWLLPGKVSLYSRLLITNLFSDLRRVLITVLVMCGCCALLVTGFTLKYAVGGVVKKQFSEVIKYDVKAMFSASTTGIAAGKIGKVLKKQGCDAVLVTDSYRGYVDNLTGATQMAEVIVGDPKTLPKFHAVNDWKTKKPIKMKDEGIYIQSRMAETQRISVGDVVKMVDDEGNTKEAPVVGVFQNYIGRTIIMTNGCYENIFEKESIPNCYLVKLNGVKAKTLEKKLKSINGFQNLNGPDTVKEMFASVSSMLNVLIMGLVALTSVMAGIILLDLTNMYFDKKTKELSIMRINGFTIAEIIGYIIGEPLVTMVGGILLGCYVGSQLAYNIIKIMEQPHFQLIRTVSVRAWCYGALITGGFACIVYMVSMLRLRGLNKKMY